MINKMGIIWKNEKIIRFKEKYYKKYLIINRDSYFVLAQNNYDCPSCSVEKLFTLKTL